MRVRKLLTLLLSVIVVSLVALVPAGTAQTGTLQARTGTRLITLGTSSGPLLRPGRVKSSNLLTVNGVHYVIDAGDGVAQRITEAGVNVRDIGTIFITHHHDDHTAGLGTLMSIAWDSLLTKPINVYGPPQTEALVNAAIQYYGISAGIRMADVGRPIPFSEMFVGHDVGTGVIYQDANIKVTAVENTHFASRPADARYKSYSYRFETPDRVIVFTGDTGPSDAVTELARGADLLVTETVSFQDRMQMMIATGLWQAMTPADREGITKQATQGHMTLEIIGKMAARANVKTLVLSHLTTRADGTDNYAPWVAEVKKYFAGQVVVANDLMTF